MIRHRAATLVLATVTAAVVLLALAGPWLAPDDPGAVVDMPYAPPGPGRWLGTDRLGRDVWSRVLTGGRELLLVPVLATVCVTVVGLALGVTAAYRQGWFDRGITRVTDLTLVFPPILVLVLLLNAWGAGAATLFVVAMLAGLPFVVRVARAATLDVRNRPYVEAAAATGERPAAVVAREIAPNVVGPVLADSGLRLVSALYLVAAAGFLGFASGRPDWGAMVFENAEGASLNPWAMVVPALLLAVLAIALNLTIDRAVRWADR